MSKLSIVVPVYNTEKYLNQCIDSILGQSFTDFALIIVDDGSTDRSGSICDEYAKADQRVIVMHTENHGVVIARRTGVNCAHGEYTTFVDSDDWIDSDFYKSIFEEAGETNADILICNRMDCGGICVETTSFQSGYYNKVELENTVFPQMMYDIQLDRYRINPSLWNKVFRKELLKTVYKDVDPIVTLGEDAVCSFPCIARANSILILENEACYHYREDHISMVNHCDIRLLQRISILAGNMNRQFAALPEIFDRQVRCFVAYNGLYAARQVLLLNRELTLCQRIRAVKDFLEQPVIAQAFREASKSSATAKLKCKIFFAKKKKVYFLLLFWIAVYMIRKLKW